MLAAIAVPLLFRASGQAVVFTVPLPAIAAAAYFGGWRIGVVASIATALVALLLPWQRSLIEPTSMRCAQLWGFVATGLLFSALAELNHRYEAALVRGGREREELVTRLRASNAAKDEFLSLVSHELRTPLTTIGGNAEVLWRNDGKLHDESRRDALHDIVSSSDRLNRIINDMLVLARGEHGGTLDAEPVRPERIARKVAAEREAASARPIQLNAAPYDGYALADEGAFSQILENLLNNAIKYSAPGSPIEVTTSGTQHEVLVSVRDRGIGISRDDASEMFAPFYRSEAAASRAGGMGLGLAVCKRLADAMHARIWVEPRDGGGAVFTIALPKAPDEDPER